MLLSVIIVSFNTKEILKECLESLKKGCQGLGGDWEVIVVDNGSTDGSAEEVKNYLSATVPGREKLKIILNRNNLGFARAVNQGIKKAKGKYFLLLNSDIVCQKGSITKLVEFAQGKGFLGVVGGGLVDPDGKPQASVFHFPTVWRAFQEFWLNQKGVFQKYLPQTNKPIEVQAVVGAVMLIPKETIKKIGFLDERYFMYFEDLDYCRRVKRADLEVHYFPQGKFIHYHGQSGQKMPQKVKHYLSTSSKIYHGKVGHCLINLIIWTGQKWQKLLEKD